MSSKLTLNIDSIEQTLNGLSQRGPKKQTQEKDPRQFRPTIKNEKKEYRAVVRFIPQTVPGMGPSKPYTLERWSHSFTENGQWYFENCPTLLNIKNNNKEHRCPACEQNRQDHKAGQDVLVARARSRKVKKSYVTNIYVIEDPQHPENNGKVMYWNMPVEIYKMIEAKWKPESKKRASSNPYCPINGYSLELVLKHNPASGYANYDGSEFLDPERLAETDEQIIEILTKAIDLDEFTGLSTYKSYEDLNKRFQRVTSGGIIVDSTPINANTVFAEESAPAPTPMSKATSTLSTKAPAPAAVASPLVAVVPTIATETAGSDDDWLD